MHHLPICSIITERRGAIVRLLTEHREKGKPDQAIEVYRPQNRLNFSINRFDRPLKNVHLHDFSLEEPSYRRDPEACAPPNGDRWNQLVVDRLHRGDMYSLLKPTGQIESGGPNVIRTHDLPVISRALHPG